ncbi:MAG: hypothetical protein EA396_10135 [Anaerolineaceae bacterium]|nr:MAG: hypothetical protein EA396_10135 [Anaerolineaceae bacterium]
MKPITLTYIAADQKLAAQIRADLETVGHAVVDDVTEGGLTVVIFSAESARDERIRGRITAALDAHQHIIPVMAEPVKLPRLIEDLPLLDFSDGYDAERLRAEIKRLSAPSAPPPPVSLTPARKKSNQQTAVIIVAAAGVMFVLAIIGVVIGAFVPPADEFAGVETQIFLTRNFFIDEALPRTTEDAAAFAATVESARPTVQPFLILTATGIALNSESTFYPRSTADATAFPATLERVSTIVQERMAATVTQRAIEAASITPTPTDTAP